MQLLSNDDTTNNFDSEKRSKSLHDSGIWQCVTGSDGQHYHRHQKFGHARLARRNIAAFFGALPVDHCQPGASIFNSMKNITRQFKTSSVHRQSSTLKSTAVGQIFLAFN